MSSPKPDLGWIVALLLLGCPSSYAQCGTPDFRISYDGVTAFSVSRGNGSCSCDNFVSYGATPSSFSGGVSTSSVVSSGSGSFGGVLSAAGLAVSGPTSFTANVTTSGGLSVSGSLTIGTSGGLNVLGPSTFASPATIQGLVTANQGFSTPRYSVTQVINYVGLPPVYGNYTSHGGSLIVIAGVSAFTTSGNAVISANVLFNGATVVVCRIYCNEASSHRAMVCPITTLSGISAGVNMINITAGSGTSTSVWDVFTVGIIELPF